MPAHRRDDCVAPLSPDDRRLDEIRAAILTWFESHGRDLPWRHTRDPYQVLVAELMLQQNRVARVIPYYTSFVERFPSFADLAVASRADVIRACGDLGRYRSAAALHETALRVTLELGELPSDLEALRTLPGIGRYTAGAVACFAFERDVVFLDTNMHRVLHRLLIGVEASTRAREAELRLVAERVLPAGDGWRWNSALIDFGALQCQSRKPLCGTCPLQPNCPASPQLADNPRLPRRTAPSRYEGTPRFYRGRVLEALRDGPDRTISAHELGSRLRPDYATEHAPWLRTIVASLAKDGLAAIEEESPPYDPDAEESWSVRLP
jgi:A/G-specific adenine glycosylase